MTDESDCGSDWEEWLRKVQWGCQARTDFGAGTGCKVLWPLLYGILHITISLDDSKYKTKLSQTKLADCIQMYSRVTAVSILIQRPATLE